MPQPPATKPLGLPFIELQSVDSTNNYARQQVHAGLAQHGMAFFAHEQVEGKGQRGKIWTTEKDNNIILSIVVDPAPLQLRQQFQLSACLAVAVHEFFSKYAGDQTKIKWPNDLYWQDRKAGGILIENIVIGKDPGIGNSAPVLREKKQGQSNRIWISIIGIGININQTSFPETLRNPVSLKQITGKNFNVTDLAKELCLVADKRFTELTTGGGDSIAAYYLEHLYKRKEKVKLKKGSRTFEVIIEGISPTGKLITEHAIREEFDFGEIEWVL